MAHGNFEWVTEWSSFAHQLSPSVLQLAGEGLRAIDIGCGTSTLAVSLAHHGYSEVTAVDREASCIEHMRALYANRSDVRWQVCDVCETSCELEDGSFELVVDKGMLDCALVEHCAAALLSTVTRLLAAGGVYAVISFRKQALLRRLLHINCLLFDAMDEVDLPVGDGGGSLCLFRRRVDSFVTPDLNALATHIDRTLDWWYTQEVPLLTKEREQQICLEWDRKLENLNRNAFGPAHSLNACTLSLQSAFEVLLSDEERTEVQYEDFTQDLVYFFKERFGREELPERISLQEGLAYLEHSQ
ncbi:hypothetical protein AB1Y20_008459 [Prymnesium parvum]|uniref:Methyltransferase domain-containing protein n=1 Tax=Prymnesium parvum TaxID=97485 RepID=A0AB34ISI8_PRYPA|mmetsp:Transcript_2833/g.5909  ORF Transcript_2833/g.5909 Transcript_2833/m.5909 type:complete len:301 (-) Transcript_2833:119-1021(-)